MVERMIRVGSKIHTIPMSSTPFRLVGSLLLVGKLAHVAGYATDVCVHANDGVCDDGGNGAVHSLCSVNTDITDCCAGDTGPTSQSCFAYDQCDYECYTDTRWFYSCPSGYVDYGGVR